MTSDPTKTLGCVELFHLGEQCPWFTITRENLRSLAERTNSTFHSYDLFECAKQDLPDGIFFSFNTVVNHKMITGSPIFSSSIEQLDTTELQPVVDGIAEALPKQELSSFVELSPSTIADSVRVCCNGMADFGNKQEWFSRNQDIYRGIVGYYNGQPKAILEFIDLEKCPFPLVPKLGDSILILCLYSNDEEHDFTDSMLRFFLAFIGKVKAGSVFVLVGENSAYPNGPSQLFLERGFFVRECLGETSILGKGKDRVLLMEKSLREV